MGKFHRRSHLVSRYAFTIQIRTQFEHGSSRCAHRLCNGGKRPEIGWVASIKTAREGQLGHPSGNITGLSVMATDLSAKRLRAAKRRSWCCGTPPTRNGLCVRETERAAERLNVAFLDSGARNLDGLEERFSMLSKQRPEALLVAAEPLRGFIEIGFLISRSRTVFPRSMKTAVSYGPAGLFPMDQIFLARSIVQRVMWTAATR